MHTRSKHIETNFYFIWDKTEDGTIPIHYVPSDKMAADIHRHEIFIRNEGGNIQNCFDGNRLYAISSCLNGGVRISIKL